MRKHLTIRKAFAAVALGAGAALAVAAPAMAEREFVGGGTWDYGRAGFGTILYSNYYHQTVNHGSSVETNGIVTRSQCVGPNQWSHAETNAAVSGNKTYWRYC